MKTLDGGIRIRPAKLSDAKDILRLIRLWAEKGKLLPRSLNDIYERIRDFFVYESEDGKLIGAVSLAVVWEDMAEVRSLVVEEGHDGKGIGTALVRHCIETARGIGVKQLFALTYVPKFFVKLGFSEIDKQTLPHKIWSDCVRCHKFPDCDESAVMTLLDNGNRPA
ncbi:MAG: N-acetyltransferase [Nitrospinae bacterium]|nr:N-acetyltransferase [Nitrospinota bacterium]